MCCRRRRLLRAQIQVRAFERWKRIAETIRRIFRLRQIWAYMGNHLNRFRNLKEPKAIRNRN